MPPKQGEKTPSYYGGYDYRTLAKYADKLFLMTYNWHWPGGPSGPIAPLNEIRTVLDYAVTVVPRSKLMLGIPQYAYDWTISGEQRSGIAYSTQGAIDRYMSRESQIFYDYKAAAPWFRYEDKNQKLHEVWFEDPRSLLAKFRLVKEYRLGGLGCWHLGTSMPQTEEILLKEFTVQ
jgi:spore germination protein